MSKMADNKVRKSIIGIKDCYGCGVCALACSRKIISIELNGKGFYEPRITDEKLCTNCGICYDVCALQYNRPMMPDETVPQCFAAWSNDSETREECSSGGIGLEICKQMMVKEGYKVIAVKYNKEKKRAEHFLAENVHELLESRGSKYIQSYTAEGFAKINRKDRYIITGTPCQIDSLRRYIRKIKIEDNFILVDFFCHSVPSYLAWSMYANMKEKNLGGSPDVVKWRDKKSGWHDSYSIVLGKGKNIIRSKASDGDVFLKMFLGDLCCNEACSEKCKYKQLNSAADIRIGDLWGTSYRHDEKGVSALIAFTEKGKKATSVLDGCSITKHDCATVCEGQMKVNAKKGKLYPLVMKMLRSGKPYSESLWKLIILCETVLNINKRLRKFF